MPTALGLVAAAFLVSALWFWLAARCAPGATARAAARAALALGAGATVPWLPLLALPLRWADPSLPWLGAAGGAGTGVQPVAAILLWVVVLRFGVAAVLLPRHLTAHDGLLDVDDERFLARVAGLAQRLSAPLPRVRTIGSAGGTLDTFAFAHGVVVPTLVVSDGILHRLAPDERDAIIAHELAHLRRRSSTQMFALLGGAGAAGTLATLFVPVLAAVCWALLLGYGMLRLHGHRDEPACDRDGGKAAGFAAMAMALDKLHGADLPDDDRPLSRWIHATQRHPGRSVRLLALRRAAPPEAAARIEVDAARAAAHRATYRLCLAAWLSALGLLLLLGHAPGRWPWAVLAGAGALLLPALLLRRARARPIAHARELGLAPRPTGFLLDAAGLGAGLALVPWLPRFPPLLALGAGLAAVALASTFVWRRRLPSVRGWRAIDLLFRRHEFEAVVARAATLPRRAQRQPLLRYLVAVATAAAGDRAAGARELVALQQQRPRLRAAALTASALLRPIDPARSLALARQLAAALPRNPFALGRLAAAELHAGELARARAAVTAGLAEQPRSGILHAIAARVCLATGDRSAAAAHLAEAERRAAGDAVVLLARAEHERASGGDFPHACRVLRAALPHHPLAFLDDEVAAVCGPES